MRTQNLEEPTATPQNVPLFLPRLLLRFFSIGLIIAAVVLAGMQRQAFSKTQALLPPGSSAGSIPVGGLSPDEAADRLRQAYQHPIELRYRGAVIRLDPETIDFQLDLPSMLPDQTAAPNSPQYWQAFWNSLWNFPPEPFETRLKYTFSEEKLRNYLLTEIASRYDRAPEPARPVPASVIFQPGQEGTALDIPGSIALIEPVLASLGSRQVDLPVENVAAPAMDLHTLQILLQQQLQVSNFTGLAGIYLLDPQTGQELHFAYRLGENISVQPDVAFTASSIIKIAILVSVFRRLESAPDERTAALLHQMIAFSSNDAADALMKEVIDDIRGPLLVSEDMEALGLENTFLAGYFALGSPLLKIYETPANQRLDVNTDPDPYNQTTAGDIGALLGMIYQCASSGTGKLVAAFPGEIDQQKCQSMIAYLKEDRQPYLITAGLPEGTPIGHKHGYGSISDVIHSIGDAAAVFSPQKDYVFVVFLYDPQLLLWDDANALTARLSRAVYNFYNLPQPTFP
jgi:beta-lactamase class A